MELKNVINFDAIRISHDKADLKYKMNTALLGSVVGVCGFQLHNIFFFAILQTSQNDEMRAKALF